MYTIKTGTVKRHIIHVGKGSKTSYKWTLKAVPSSSFSDVFLKSISKCHSAKSD